MFSLKEALSLVQVFPEIHSIHLLLEPEKHVITYRYVNALNCPSVIQKEIEVLEMINSDIQFSALPDILR